MYWEQRQNLGYTAGQEQKAEVSVERRTILDAGRFRAKHVGNQGFRRERAGVPGNEESLYLLILSLTPSLPQGFKPGR